VQIRRIRLCLLGCVWKRPKFGGSVCQSESLCAGFLFGPHINLLAIVRVRICLIINSNGGIPGQLPIVAHKCLFSNNLSQFLIGIL